MFKFLVLSLFVSFGVSWHLKMSLNSNVPKTYAESVRSSISKVAAVSSILTTSSLLAAAPSFAEEEVKKAKKAKKPKVLETPDLGIKYIEVAKGSGPFPAPGDFVVISYTGFLKDGTVFDSTETKGRKPLSFRFGQKQIIPGLESVLSEMQPGGQATCNIPAQYAYGAKGVCLEKDVDKKECLVPPNEDLKYFVKLISVGAGYN